MINRYEIKRRTPLRSGKGEWVKYEEVKELVGELLDLIPNAGPPYHQAILDAEKFIGLVDAVIGAEVFEHWEAVSVCPSCDYENEIENREIKTVECGNCGISFVLKPTDRP